MRLCFMPTDWDGSGHYRCMFPARELMRHGVDVEMPPHKKVPFDTGRKLHVVYGAFTKDGRHMPVELALRLRPKFDLLVMQTRREVGLTEKWLTKDLGVPYVVDRDDAFLNLPAYNPGSRRSAEETREMISQFQGAAAMTVSTPAIAEELAPFCDDITVIRNTLDWEMWENAPQQSEVERRRVRVGYMGDVRYHSADLKVLRGVLGPWLERNPHVEFVAAGDTGIHDLLGVPKAQRVSTTWVGFHAGDLADITATFDIGIVPLASEHMNECKSHLKGLEYAACGIPCIATPTESYKWWHEWARNSCLLADKPHHWTNALDLLVNDDVLRRDLGRRARSVSSEHTIQNHWTEWKDVYERVCGTHSDAARETVAA
jgi:hypothetical protein